MKQLGTLTLNIVSNDPQRVFNELRNVIEKNYYGTKVTFKNRVSMNITEFEIASTQLCCISLETFKEILYFIPDYDIRILLG